MSRLTNRLEKVERAARCLDPSNNAWRLCCSMPGETNEQAIQRHCAQYGRRPLIVVPEKTQHEDTP